MQVSYFRGLLSPFTSCHFLAIQWEAKVLLKEVTSVEALVSPIQGRGALSLGSIRCGLMGLLEST